MKFSVEKAEIWGGKIEDRPGGLAKVLGALASAGADLECVIARRELTRPGAGVLFLSPIKGRAVRAAAKSQRLAPAKNISTLRVEGENAAGLGARIITAISEEGINLRGVSATVRGSKFVAYLGFDRATDAAKAAKALKVLAKADKGKK